MPKPSLLPGEERGSAAGDQADDFEAVAVVECGRRPLGAEEGGAVVFDEGGSQGEAEFGDEFLDLRGLDVALCAVEEKFHRARIDWSQSFHTGSRPSVRRRAATSCGGRWSDVENCSVARAPSGVSQARARPRTVR